MVCLYPTIQVNLLILKQIVNNFYSLTLRLIDRVHGAVKTNTLILYVLKLGLYNFDKYIL